MIQTCSLTPAIIHESQSTAVPACGSPSFSPLQICPEVLPAFPEPQLRLQHTKLCKSATRSLHRTKFTLNCCKPSKSHSSSCNTHCHAIISSESIHSLHFIGVTSSQPLHRNHSVGVIPFGSFHRSQGSLHRNHIIEVTASFLVSNAVPRVR